MKHKDKIVLVTGASQGLGLACTERFLADGARVMMVDLNADALQAQVKRLGDRTSWWAGDLNEVSTEMAADMVAKTVSDFGGIDVLVNNAGIMHQAPFVDFAEADFDRVLRINLKSPFLIGQAAAKAMIAAGKGGNIINMSSVNALLAIPTAVAYAVSKGGIKQLTAVMAVSLAPHGIRVNAIGPGTILTDMARKAVMTNDEQRRGILSRTPIGRCGEPSEVASVASFLASDDASYIIGQTIYPDGGRLVLNYTVPVVE